MGLFVKEPKKDYSGYCYMKINELINKLNTLNPNWSDSCTDILNDKISRAVVLEEEWNKLKSYGTELFEDAPLTMDTPEQIKRKEELRSEILNIMEEIVELFKKSTDMQSLRNSEKRFLYNDKEEYKESKKR